MLGREIWAFPAETHSGGDYRFVCAVEAIGNGVSKPARCFDEVLRRGRGCVIIRSTATSRQRPTACLRPHMILRPHRPPLAHIRVPADASLGGPALGIGVVHQYILCFPVEMVIETLPIALAWIDICWRTTDVDAQIKHNARSSLTDQCAPAPSHRSFVLYWLCTANLCPGWPSPDQRRHTRRPSCSPP
jgi:hypothetical protein